jgi:hypothetical protein
MAFCDSVLLLISMAHLVRTTSGFASAVVSSLHSVYWTFHRVLCAQVEVGPPLLPDTEEGLRDYLAEWGTAVQAVS